MEYTDFVNARRSYLGASDAPIIMGVSPWSTLYELWQDKLNIGLKREDNVYMQRGRDMEPVALEAYTLETGNIAEAKQVFHPDVYFMMANLDGLTEDGLHAVEIKCPGEKDHKIAKEGRIPPKYYPQLQHQLVILNAISGVTEMDYFSYRDGDTALIKVTYDPFYCDALIEKEFQFWELVENLTPPKLAPKEQKTKVFKVDSNLKALDIETEIIRLKPLLEEKKNDFDNVKKMIEDYKEELKEISNGDTYAGNGIQLMKSLTKGRIDYSSIDELKGVDLEKYRSEPSEKWTLKYI
jgi:putative phage-type endonuclease